MMLRQITVEHRTPKIATATGVADLSHKKPHAPTALLATLATLTLLTTTTACSSNSKPKKPTINPASPRAAAPLIPPSGTTTPSSPPASIDDAEAISIAQNYFTTGNQAKISHDVDKIGTVESGPLFEMSDSEQQRIKKYGDTIQIGDNLAATSGIKSFKPIAAGNGDSVLVTGRQTLNGKSRSALGLLSRDPAANSWKMSFMTFTKVGGDLPSISTPASSPATGSKVDSLEVCGKLANYLEGSPGSTKWSAQVAATPSSIADSKKAFIESTKGGSMDSKTIVRPDSPRSTYEIQGGKTLVLCATQSTIQRQAGSGQVITIKNNYVFQDLAGKTTTWKQRTEVNMGMWGLVVGTGDSIEIVGQIVKPLSGTGTAAS
ncbi:hypothetical protein [Embleya sp. NBC_00896]|uniref:hypothetical protein n=1 Tax=Embleya sp. NBC_00896 TaxID=2975961 RepID=UPI003865654D|nr:hypothetical protein OG928_07680 [Embleya sp. NBC_00896]